jgi:hypothetical protein
MTAPVRNRSIVSRLVGALLGVAVIVGAAFAVVRLAFDHESEPPEPAASARSSEARDSLCVAAAAVRRADVSTARKLFFGRTHDQLHMLAADTAKRSRPAAARLLEAKAKVEGGVDPPAATLADDLEVLAVATGRAMAAAGGIDPGPCSG